MCNAKRDIDLGKKNNFPGVGQYDLTTQMYATHNRASKCTFGKENRDRSPLFKENMCKPGVGAYDGSGNMMMKTGPKIGFSKAKRPELI